MSFWDKTFLIIVFAALAVIIAGRANAGFFSAAEEARLTRETPYRMDCPFVSTAGYHDCGEAPAQQETSYPVENQDYLPAVVPGQTQDMPPLLPSLLGAAYTACRKAGKNSEYCSDGPHYGADDYQKAAGY